MQPEERDAGLVHDMLEFCLEVGDYTAGVTYEVYAMSREKRRSVERVMALIGEAAYQLSDRFRATHVEIPWKDIIGLRHVLVHGYGRVDHARLWRVATSDVPALLKMLESVLPSQ